MASLSSIYLKKETLKTLYQTLEKKGEKGIEITISIGEETNDYGQNLTAYVAQTKEQRASKLKRFYVGNGKTFWTDGTIQVADKKQESTQESHSNQEQPSSEEGDLPF